MDQNQDKKEEENQNHSSNSEDLLKETQKPKIDSDHSINSSNKSGSIKKINIVSEESESENSSDDILHDQRPIDLTKVEKKDIKNSNPENKKNIREEQMRHIRIGAPRKIYGNNFVSFRKYKSYSFFFINFAEQFGTFLVSYLTLIWCIKFFSNFYQFDSCITYTIILYIFYIIYGIVDFLEDLRMKKIDESVQVQKVEAWKKGKSKLIKQKDLYPGEIILIKENEKIPADCLLLYSSSLEKRNCYLDTSLLNGQTHYELKYMIFEEHLVDFDNQKEFLAKIHDKMIIYEKENNNIEEIKGSVRIEQIDVDLNIKNILLQGSVLKNTDYVYAVVLYTGKDCKIFQSTLKAKNKTGSLESSITKYLNFSLIALIVLSIFTSFFNVIYLFVKKKNFEAVISFETFPIVILYINRLITWFLNQITYIPFTIFIALTWARYFQGRKMEQSLFFKSKSKDENGMEDGRMMPTIVNNSKLNDELGRINFILSDKTGTLTKNKISFQKLIVGGNIYAAKEQKNSENKFKEKKQIDENLMKLLQDKKDKKGEECRKAFRCLVLCHDAYFDENKQINYSCPEEKAILKFCQSYGFQYKPKEISDEKTKEQILVIREFNKRRKFKLIKNFAFSSSRKRNSVIFISGNKMILFTIGAEDIIEDMLTSKDQIPEYNQMSELITQECDKGQRVLSLAWKEIGVDQWDTWLPRYEQSKNKEELITELEQGLKLIGAIALKDEIQEQIKDSIEFIREAGIKFWIVSGDHQKPIASVAIQSKIIEEKSKVVYFDMQKLTTERFLQDVEKQIENKNKTVAIVSSQYFQSVVESDIQVQDGFFKLITKFDFALFYRMNSNEKGLLTRMLREYDEENRVLGIGDGVNDLNMLSSANVGVGIINKAGFLINYSADYTIGEFKYLIPLMFVFGRECYRKNSILVSYNFYKNFLLTFPTFWFGCFNFFSGQNFYHFLIGSLFNLVFTAIPIQLLAVEDKIFPKKKLLFNPIYYKTGLDNFYFSFINYTKIIGKSLIITLFLTLLAVAFFDYGTYEKGYSYGFWNTGNMIYLGVILLSNFNLFYISNSYSLIYIISIFCEIIIYFIVWIIVNSVEQYDLYRSFKEVTDNHHFYLYILGVFGLSICDYLLTRMDYLLFESRYMPKFLVSLQDVKHSQTTDQYKSQQKEQEPQKNFKDQEEIKLNQILASNEKIQIIKLIQKQILFH